MRHLTCVLLLIGVVCIGCGRKSEGIQGIVKAAGTVTFQGKPVEGASVVFSPADKGKPASATTDTSGHFTLTTQEAGDGALPGKYTVTVSKVIVENMMTANEAMEWFKKHGAPKKTNPPKNLLPEKFKDAKTSGLTADVPAGGKTDFAFSLD